MIRRPDIIIFNPDEMRADAMGHMGNPAAVTPFLDAFAHTDAVSFRNAFCQNPVCVPSRCSFFTGLYPHVNGHRTMSYLLHPGEENLFSELKRSGYTVWMNARNDLFAGQISGWAEENADTIFYGGDVPAAPGPVKPPQNKKPDDKDCYTHFTGKLAVDENGKNYNPDDEAVDAAIDYISRYDADKPFCIFLGLMAPHCPYQVEEPYASAIDRGRLKHRIQFSECSGKSEMIRLLHQYQNIQYGEDDWNELRSVYLGMCMKVDSQFRRLCDALKKSGRYEDSLIIFLSDHGDFEGDYDLTEKAQSSFEDCLTRVPLIIKPPVREKADPGKTDALAELVDFYATVMDYSDTEIQRTQFGHSLRKVIENRETAVRNFVTCEGGRLPGEDMCDEYHSFGPDGPPVNFPYYPKMKAQSNDHAHAKGVMIRNHHAKYISRITGEDEFYDLDRDPGETVNEIDNPVYADRIEKMRLLMLRWYMQTSDTVPREYDKRFTDEMLWARVKNICPPDHEAEVKEKIRQGIKQAPLTLYVRKLAAEQKK